VIGVTGGLLRACSDGAALPGVVPSSIPAHIKHRKTPKMAVKLNSLRADTRRENDGDWVEIPDLPGVALKVRGFAYGPFQNAKSQAEAKWARRSGGRDTVPYDEVFKTNGRLYAQYLLLDWKGFDEPYDLELAQQILADPAYRELHDHIRYATNRVSQVDAEFVEDAAGNSERSSAGKSAKAAA